MKRTKPRKKSVVTLLREAEPAFVSMVRRGANQRPFHAIKSEGGQAATQENEDMAKERKIKAAPTVAVHRIAFDKATFPDVASVEEFLTAKGYSDFTIVEEDASFHVEDTPVDQIEGETRPVESTTAKGVTYIVGDAKKSALPDPKDDAGIVPKEEGADDDKPNDDGKPGDKPADEPPADPKPEGDKPEGSAPGADTKAPADAGGEETTQKAADVKPRQRSRKAAFEVQGLTPTALAAAYEGLGEFLEEHGVTAKSFADTVADYTGGVAPGLWALAEAFMGELHKGLKAGRADEAYVSGLANEYASSVVKMTAAYQSIISDAATAAKSENAEPDLGPVLDHLFGPALQAAGENGDVTAIKSGLATLQGEVGTVAANQTAMLAFLQTVLDRSAVAEYEDAMKGEKREETARVIPSRKSQDAEESVADSQPDTEAEAEAEAAEQKRVAKRLGIFL